MAARMILAFCVSALLVQTAFSQCAPGPAGSWGLPSLAGSGLAGFGPGLGLAGGYGAGCGCGVASTGGSLVVSSASPVAPIGVSLFSENCYEGILNAGGNVPFLGTVGIEGVVPTAGVGTISYGCGNGAVGITAEEGPIITGIAPSVGSVAGFGYNGLGYNDIAGLCCNEIAGLGYNGETGLGYNGLAGFGCNDRAGLVYNGVDGLGCNNIAGLGYNGVAGLGFNNIGLGYNGVAGFGYNDIGLGCNSVAGLDYNDISGLGYNGVARLGYNDIGFGYNDISGLGCNGFAGLGYNDISGLGYNGLTGLGYNDVAGLGYGPGGCGCEYGTTL